MRTLSSVSKPSLRKFTATLESPGLTSSSQVEMLWSVAAAGLPVDTQPSMLSMAVHASASRVFLQARSLGLSPRSMPSAAEFVPAGGWVEPSQ